MRDLLMVALFVGVLPFALRYTWVGVLLWTWLSIMNPHRLTFGFAYDLPFAAITAAVTLASLLWNINKWRVPRDATVGTLVLFVLWMCVTTVFAIYPERSLPDLDRAVKIQVMTLAAMVALRERKHIELFIWVNVLSLGVYGAKGGLFTLATGGGSRVWGPQGSFLEGNNELGLALIMAIPLMNYLRLVAVKLWVRWGLLLLMLLSAAAALGTQSRGAFLAILAMGAVLWARSQRKLASAVGIFSVSLVMLAFMPSTWEVRMRTIGDYETDTSAQGRINAWITAVRIANDRFTGGGFLVETPEVFLRYAPDPNGVYAAHSIYFQVIGEHGYVGFALFALLGILTFRTTMSLRRQAREVEQARWLYDLAGMVQVSMVGYAVGGSFLSLAYFDLPYNVVVIMVACRAWFSEERWKTEPLGAFGAGAPSARPPTRAAKQGA